MNRINKFIAAIIVVFSLVVNLGSNVYAASTNSWHDNDYRNPGKIIGLHIGADDISIPEFYDRYACNNMINLMYFTVDDKNTELTAYDGVLYNKDKTLLVCFPQGLKAASIPESCVNIMPQALYGTSFSIRRQVKAIITRNNGGTWPGYYRFVNMETEK